MTKLYTRSGDNGFSGLLGKDRLPKYNLVFETLGDLDEASAALGIVRASLSSPDLKTMILTIQRDLYKIMAQISSTKETIHHFKGIGKEQVSWLEKQTDRLGDLITLPKDFIVPGDTIIDGHVNLARTIIRRAERSVTRFYHEQEIENPDTLSYLNRLSSLCYALGVYVNNRGDKKTTTLAKERK
ncbi:MAG TPA: cob(I)yrinic acid a,c-diamide adenosyltransferase [Anaerolineae bacterium]|nr:cob(I)yrinic acid a,c-diamide adenosyltransferase [Anaerolineae bacterium]